MRRSRNPPLPAGRLDYIIFVSGIIPQSRTQQTTPTVLSHHVGFFTLCVTKFVTPCADFSTWCDKNCHTIFIFSDMV